MLTAPARAYYQLEASYGQDEQKQAQGFAQFSHPRVQRLRCVEGELDKQMKFT